MRKDHAQEVAVRAIAAARFRHPGCRRRAVVAVGDVDCRQRVEHLRERLDHGRFVDHPKLMSDVVVGRDGNVGITLGGALEQCVDLRRMRVAHHHGAGLRIEGLDLLDAVGLLHRRRQLVLAHPVGCVVGKRGNTGKARLPPAGPRRAIGVVVRVGVAHKDTLGDHALEVFCRRGVDGIGIGIGARRQVDLGLGDMQEAPRLAACPLARLRAGEHVIGRRDHLARTGRYRAQSPKGADKRHALLLSLLGSASFSGSGLTWQCPRGL